MSLRIDVLTREVLERELDALLSIDAEVPLAFAEPWSREHFLHELPGKWTYSMAASDAGGIAAFAIFSVKGEALHLHRIVVRRECRRHGIATRFYLTAARRGMADGYRYVTAKVAACNEAALAMQRRVGGRVCGSEGSNVLWMHDAAILASQGPAGAA
ncbi:MAG: GNAT family N-acetyltransferase [Candidatus Binatia bacterium]